MNVCIDNNCLSIFVLQSFDVFDNETEIHTVGKQFIRRWTYTSLQFQISIGFNHIVSIQLFENNEIDNIAANSTVISMVSKRFLFTLEKKNSEIWW